MEERPFTAYTPLVYAYVGDAVFETVVRTVLALRGYSHPKNMNQSAVHYVNAAAQAFMADAVAEELTAEEAGVMRRGRNANPGTTAKHASVADYRKATGMEALTGFLFLSGKEERLSELIRLGMEAYDRKEEQE